MLWDHDLRVSVSGNSFVLFCLLGSVIFCPTVPPYILSQRGVSRAVIQVLKPMQAIVGYWRKHKDALERKARGEPVEDAGKGTTPAGGSGEATPSAPATPATAPVATEKKEREFEEEEEDEDDDEDHSHSVRGRFISSTLFTELKARQKHRNKTEA